MIKMPTMLRFCALAVFGLVMLSGAQALAQTVDNGCTDINGVRLGDCSRLDKGNGRVTIRATDCGNPDSTVPDCSTATAAIYDPVTEDGAECRTIYNGDSLDYFVPWKTAEEWGKFLAWAQGPGAARGLSIHSCCEPKIGTVCANQIYNGTNIGPAGLQVLDPTTSTPIQLGKRVLGVRGGGIGDYGAQTDVSNMLDTAVLLGDSTINYKVTYVCNAGNWIKTFEEGSCTPLDGACGASVPSGGVTSNQLGELQQQNLLCTTGSVMRNLTDHGTYWTWDCLGTPGRADSVCTVPSLEINNGSAQCGTAVFGRLASPPTTAAQLCTLGTPSAVNGTGTQTDPWAWVCNGTFGSSQSCRAFSNTALIDGLCGTSNGTKTTDANWSPGTGAALCGNGTQLLGTVTQSSSGWSWTCAGERGGIDKACLAELSTGGYIGWCGTVDTTSGSTPPNPAVAGMCNKGTPTAVTYGPDYQNDGRMSWMWSCIGTVTPPCNTPSTCYALGHRVYCQKYDLNGAQPAICGWGASYGWYKTTPPTKYDFNFCATGNTVSSGPTWNDTILPPQWQWTCQGANGGGTVNCQTKNTAKSGNCNYFTVSNFTVTDTTPLPANACGLEQTPVNKRIEGSTYAYDCPGVWGGTTAACKVGYNPGFVKTGVCGSAHNTQLAKSPSPWKLCSYGAPSKVAGGHGPIWTWTCQGTVGTTPTPCTTIYSSGSTPPTGTNGVCGSADRSITNTAPTSNLCSVGTPTAVSGSGPWTWSCPGTGTGTTDVCIANTPTSVGEGQCGATHGTAIPSQPNTNLCASGTPSSVTGSGPWLWDCVGTTTASCSANLCDVCAGDLPAVAKSDALTNRAITYGGGTCTVNGTVNWTQVNSLSGDNAAQDLVLANNAAALTFYKSVVPPAAPNRYCPPCYRRAKTISGSFTVQKSGSACTGSLDDGNPVTITINNVQIN
ncbi:MAG: hypothetical protein WBK91_02275 [Alphaproteobacteria bacterium]